jgi:hypothetical protein
VRAGWPVSRSKIASDEEVYEAMHWARLVCTTSTAVGVCTSPEGSVSVRV